MTENGMEIKQKLKLQVHRVDQTLLSSTSGVASLGARSPLNGARAPPAEIQIGNLY